MIESRAIGEDELMRRLNVRIDSKGLRVDVKDANSINEVVINGACFEVSKFSEAHTGAWSDILRFCFTDSSEAYGRVRHRSPIGAFAVLSAGNAERFHQRVASALLEFVETKALERCFYYDSFERKVILVPDWRESGYAVCDRCSDGADTYRYFEVNIERMGEFAYKLPFVPAMSFADQCLFDSFWREPGVVSDHLERVMSDYCAARFALDADLVDGVYRVPRGYADDLRSRFFAENAASIVISDLEGERLWLLKTESCKGRSIRLSELSPLVSDGSQIKPFVDAHSFEGLVGALESHGLKSSTGDSKLDRDESLGL